MGRRKNFHSLISRQELGDKIRKARLEIGLSQKSLGSLVKVAPSSIAHIEKGNYYPTYSTIVGLANALNLPLSQLTGIEENSGLNSTLATLDSEILSMLTPLTGKSVSGLFKDVLRILVQLELHPERRQLYISQLYNLSENNIENKTVGKLSDEYINAVEASILLGRHCSRIYGLIRKGKLTAKKTGRVWVITRQSLEEYQATMISKK